MNYEKILQILKTGNPVPDKRVEKSDEEWKEVLNPEEYRITRLAQTESPNSSGLCHLYEPGLYACVCCNTPLFDSSSKFESGSGWPSFTEPVKGNVVSYLADESHDMSRIEITCSTCDAHLGHVFPDGPEPSGLRFCVNGLSVKKI
jgi:peptide-methionine (R)-S-oxide reductase